MEQGYALMCVCYPQTDCSVRVIPEVRWWGGGGGGGGEAGWFGGMSRHLQVRQGAPCGAPDCNEGALAGSSGNTEARNGGGDPLSWCGAA